MLVSSQFPPVPLSSMSHSDSNTDRSQQTHRSSLIPPTLLPKYFNVSFAIQHGYFRCIRYLLQLCYDPNERDSQLRTPLILCSYVENDRWSLSLAQNLLEKGAKVALEDHARRNALHHACALQRINLVQLYLSCVDFNLEARDCEGNTCLHYVAITGNCEIAELLIKSADKMDIRLDQYVNRDGCSAAVLALKYGHIECANQITHRDWDEFFVIPRPLSIYETRSKTDENHGLSTTATSKQKTRTTSHNSSSNKNDVRPSTISFGLLKIIFNENDSSYSTRLAGFCNESKQTHHHRRIRHKKHEKSQKNHDIDKIESIMPNSTHYCSTEALVNELQSSPTGAERKITFDDSEDNNTARASPRIQLLIQQHLTNKPNSSTEDILLSNDEIKSKTIDRQASNSTINYVEPAISILQESSRIKNKLQRPKTAIVTRNQSSVNAVGAPSRLSTPKVLPTSTQKKSKKKPSIIHRPSSASCIPRQQQQHSNLASEISSYSQTLFAGRPLSAALQHNHRHRSIQRTVDSSCSIREAKGAKSRYNKPEELFGLKPEELFGLQDHQPKILNHRATNDNTRLKRSNQQQQQQQQYIWQQEVNKLVDLFNIHHSSNYRPSAVPPPPAVVEEDTITDLMPVGRFRRTSISKNTLSFSRSSLNPKQSTLAALNIPRRNSISRRSSIRLANA
ncbi:unnamed protein product [Rotaria sp. Silwood2]|nr:unnamed protein product [Rotaria sp. Silwood2]CAF2664962.1 unnamed protein product [Rotaria sp. Silwood2]CAF3081463.1 unnamed protein product [Rotaria sp. Silwood2]CAF4181198.1 unnamed protein product [Rotaria sp. Silwood2]CAF4410934.1 unnamed protein product [Rotaria sp. Silwood2]